MSRLWHSTFQAQEDTPTNKRGFRADEVLIRHMQMARVGEPQGRCDTCDQRIKLECLVFNDSERWNTKQTCVCRACIKYGAPQGRWPAGIDYKHTCLDCGTHRGDFYRLSRNTVRQLSPDDKRWYEKDFVLCRSCAGFWWHDDCEYLGSSTPHENAILVDKWWVSVQLRTCELCGEESCTVSPTMLPKWVIAKGKYHLCQECVDACKEIKP